MWENKLTLYIPQNDSWLVCQSEFHGEDIKLTNRQYWEFIVEPAVAHLKQQFMNEDLKGES